MTNRLDSAQAHAVNTCASRILVVAGPGSGKTRVLATRLARLVREGVPPSRILAVTFTNRAAREMRERVSSFGISSRGLNVGTFHSVSLKLVRTFRPDMRLVSSEEQAAIVRALGAERAEAALAGISAFKNGVIAIDSVDKRILDGYARKLEEMNYLDLDDLVPAAAALVVERCLKPYSHIMIDEYQDINPAQGIFVRELAKGAEGLLAIGDPDQAIYAFRGSDLGCFLDFEKDFPGTEKIMLSRNYRSAGKIVAASRELISRNIRRLENDISPERGGGAIELVECADEKEESSFIIKEIEKLIGGLTSLTASDDTGMRFSDFAVLVRTNRQAEYIADEFAASSVPFSLVSSPSTRLNDFVDRLKSMIAPSGAPLKDLVMGEARAFGLDDGALSLLQTAIDSMDEGAALSELADSVALSGPADCLDIKADKVKITTLHAAKGLEWRCVFIAGTEDGLIPMRVNGECDIEEERRLFYVGVTRACDHLYLSHAKKRKAWGVQREQKRSPFINDMPSELMDVKSLEKKMVKKRPAQKGLFE